MASAISYDFAVRRCVTDPGSEYDRENDTPETRRDTRAE